MASNTLSNCIRIAKWYKKFYDESDWLLTICETGEIVVTPEYMAELSPGRHCSFRKWVGSSGTIEVTTTVDGTKVSCHGSRIILEHAGIQLPKDEDIR